MVKFAILLTFSYLFGSYSYSLEDYNATSPSYGRNIWQPEYLSYITMHYFATQGWAGWTATFGQLSNFQEELRNEDGYENIVIIGIGQSNLNNFNSNFCANSNLPLIMDSFPELPLREQFSPYYDSHALIILDHNGDYVGHIDMSNLGSAEEDYIRSILEEHYQQPVLGDVNGDSLVNILDVVLAVNLVVIPEYNNSADLNLDGNVNILDIVLIVNLIIN